MKNIGILGSTGSVGKQALDVISANPQQFKVKYLTCNSNYEELGKQANLYNPEYICIFNKNKYKSLKNINIPNGIKILSGLESFIDLTRIKDVDIVLNAISGYQGLEPTLNIISAGVDIALSNKESIVQAGHIVTKLAKKNNVNIFPVDSEHSALWQCMNGENKKSIKRLILTASGGPFRLLDENKFHAITKKDALNHPNWSMGNKITIDSATMMNKGFEVIEAFWLFNIDIKDIDIVVHPQSIIHSMIEFIDGSIKAQLSIPDMRLPIQYAFSYPERYKLDAVKNDFSLINRMDFEPIDFNKFKCIKLAYESIKLGGTYPTVLNVANDIAVSLFLKDKISFLDISNIIMESMENHSSINTPNIDNIKDVTRWTEKFILKKYS